MDFTITKPKYIAIVHVPDLSEDERLRREDFFKGQCERFFKAHDAELQEKDNGRLL